MIKVFRADDIGYFLGEEERSNMSEISWKTISANEYRLAFERFGGSFAVHPRVVTLVASLAKRSAKYIGVMNKGDLVAAVPVWDQAIVATKFCLALYNVSHLIDVGDSEIVLPVDENARITMPFIENMISNIHSANISNVERQSRNFALAKGVKIGDQRLSGKSQSRRRCELRRFQEIGGNFVPVGDLTAEDAAAIYVRLYEKRWGSQPLGGTLLPTVLRELKDMLCGDVLNLHDRPVAIELSYMHKTPRWLFVNGVQRGVDPEFANHSIGTILLFHNLGLYEQDAIAHHKLLRYSFGWCDAAYKARWTVEAPSYHLGALSELAATESTPDSLCPSADTSIRYEATSFFLPQTETRGTNGSNIIGAACRDGCVIWGPYRPVPRGKYKLCHSLQVETGPESNGILKIDVCKNSGRDILASREMLIEHSLAIKELELEFFSNGYEIFEFRVHKKGRFQLIHHGATIQRER